MGTLWNREPAMFLSLINAGLALAVGFGLTLTAEQIALLMAFSSALLGFITRTQVTPNSKPPANPPSDGGGQ